MVQQGRRLEALKISIHSHVFARKVSLKALPPRQRGRQCKFLPNFLHAQGVHQNLEFRLARPHWSRELRIHQ